MTDGHTCYLDLTVEQASKLIRMEWRVGNGPHEALSVIERVARTTDPYLYCDYERPTAPDDATCR